MIYERNLKDATQIMGGNIIMARQKIPEGYIVVYVAVKQSNEGDVTEVLYVTSEKVKVKKNLLKRIWIWFFGESYKLEPMSDHSDKRVSRSILD